MEERSNQTVMCSVLFLGIVEYSKQSVTGQISLKDRFNSSLAIAIGEVPITDRIVLDTGDGAVITFLGEEDDALKAALSLRTRLHKDGPDADQPLQLRMGINLGPVRLVRDSNGQPNIVGDGINVAQHLMSFADVDQILVSRSYFDSVASQSPQYADMFHYQGSRTDKHVREHEVYAIGYAGNKAADKTTLRRMVNQVTGEPVSGNLWQRIMGHAKAAWWSAARKLDVFLVHLAINFRRAEPQQRAGYVVVFVISLLLVVLTIRLVYRIDANNKLYGMPNQIVVPVENVTMPASAVVAAAIPKPVVDEKIEPQVKPKFQPRPKKPVEKPQERTPSMAVKKPVVESASGNSNAYIFVSCKEGTEVFIDGVRKGRISTAPLSLMMSPGKHAVIVSHPRAGVFSQDIVFEAGKTARLNPDFCN